MKEGKKMKNRKKLFVSLISLTAFLLWTLLVRLVDVQPIGPLGSDVGFARLNRFIHNLTGVHMVLYTLTDWLSLIPVAVALAFAVLGLVQWIRRKHILRVDRSILSLGVFYIVVMGIYLFFESVVINYRPVLIQGCLEASYPSSTTTLVMCVMITALKQLNLRVKSSVLRLCLNTLIILFTVFMVTARLFSGVHWITDIIGGTLLSFGLVTMYSLTVEKLQ